MEVFVFAAAASPILILAFLAILAAWGTLDTYESEEPEEEDPAGVEASETQSIAQETPVGAVSSAWPFNHKELAPNRLIATMKGETPDPAAVSAVIETTKEWLAHMTEGGYGWRYVLSGYRSVRFNREVVGAKTAGAHTKGLALDFRPANDSLAGVRACADYLAAKGWRVLVYYAPFVQNSRLPETFIHVNKGQSAKVFWAIKGGRYSAKEPGT